jgi:hypothetical protein
VRAAQRRNGFRRSAHLDPRRALAPKGVQEQLSRRATKPSRRKAGANRHPLVGPGPLKLEPATVQTPTQIPAAAPHIPPQGGIHRGREATRSSPIGPANVLVMDEELIEIRHGTDPPDAKEPDGRAGPDPRDQPRKVPAPRQSGPAPLGEPSKGTGQNQARAGDEVVFSQHEVSGEVVRGPAVEQRGSGRAELVEKVAKLEALLPVQRNAGHKAAV